MEHKLLRLDGTSIDVETAGIPFTYRGRPAAQVVLRDVGEHKRLEAQFRQAQKMEAVGQLAGGVAHDFNNLLTVITSYSGMLLTALPSTSAERADVVEIERAAHRAASLTRQLLAFSRQQVLQPRVLDLNTVARDMEKLLARLVREDIRVATILAPHLGAVYADAGQIEQVIMNLVVNARDALPMGGTITIETANVDVDGTDGTDGQLPNEMAPGPYVMLAVTDTGLGMDAETQSRIFEPFFTTKRLGEGTGLGLSTVYGIVRQSGGHVAVDSECGVGTTFRVYLPRATHDVAVARTSGGHTVLVPGTETILLAEDEASVRTVARRILERSGYRVVDVANGAEALRICEDASRTIDLLITDMVMPEMNGRELVEHARTLRPEMRVLFMSGYTDDAIGRQTYFGPDTLYLQKPFTPDALTSQVRLALRDS
jgi:signal transduction histidine kinase/ActR/RegA family two-component response regulator